MRTNSRIWIVGLTTLFLVGMGLPGTGDQGGVLLAQTAGLSTTPPYLVTVYNSTQDSYLYQYRYVNGDYRNVWASGSVQSRYGLNGDMGSGDVDNDGTVEVYAIQDYLSRTVKVGKNTVYYFKQKLVVFEPGAQSGGSPSWQSDDLEDGETTNRVLDTVLADLDGDSYKELVSLHCVSSSDNHIDVFRFVNGGIKTVHLRCGSFGQTAWTVDAGDVDGDGQGEIVVAMANGGAPYIYEFDAENGLSGPIPAQQVSLYGPGLTYLSLGWARVRDVDNDTNKEIIGLGNNGRLMIWKFDPSAGSYETVFVSDYLGYNSFSGGVDAGDINGDGLNEIIVGNYGTSKAPSSLWLFAYTGLTYELLRSFKQAASGINGIEIGDLDSDGADEIVVTLGGIRVFHFQPGYSLAEGALAQTYYNSRGGVSEIFR